MLLLVKQRLARLVPGWMIQGFCSGAVLEWVQVYTDYNKMVLRVTPNTLKDLYCFFLVLVSC